MHRLRDVDERNSLVKQPRYYERRIPNTEVRHEKYCGIKRSYRDEPIGTLCFRQFVWFNLEDTVKPSEAVDLYDKYMYKETAKIATEYFNSNKDKEWFRMSYHPRLRMAARQALNNDLERRRELFREAFSANYLNVSLVLDNKENVYQCLEKFELLLDGVENVLVKLEDESAIHRSHGVNTGNSADHVVIIRNFPDSVTVKETNELLLRFVGIDRVYLSDPSFLDNSTRSAFVTCSSAADLATLCNHINNIKVGENRLCALESTFERSVLAVEIGQNEMNTDGLRRQLSLIKNLIEHLDAPIITNDCDLVKREDDNEGAKKIESPIHMFAGEFSGEIDSKDDLMRALDVAILYLKFIHSINFYGMKISRDEHLKPLRCGSIHVRDLRTSTSTNVIDSLVSFWSNAIFGEIDPKILEAMGGEKDTSSAEQAFIDTNTVELAPDKWFCPLSGKKFRGKDFVHKHIVSKHGDALAAARDETVFFNNYLRDLNRPMPKVTFASRRDMEILPKRLRLDKVTSAPYTPSVQGRTKMSYHDLDAPKEDVAAVLL